MPPLVAVIDDDAVIVTLLGEILTDEGYQTCGFGAAAEAREALPALRPDLIMLDVRLGGGIAAWDFLAELRQTPATAATPILICSADAHSLQEHADTLRAFGCATLHKPFDLETLLGAVASLIASSGSSEQTA